MIYWVVFLLYEFALIYAYKNSKHKWLSAWFITIGLIYYASFRDGLGIDYYGYVMACEDPYIDINIIDEPTYALIREFVYSTEYSPIIFFIIMATITYSLIANAYYRQSDFPFLISVFILYPALYVSSFNLVRQFAAAAIFLYAILSFRKNKNLLVYLGFIFIAFSIHKSAILLLLIPLINSKGIKPIIWIGLIICSLILPINKVLDIGPVNNIMNFLDYMDYSTYKETPISRFSLVNIFTHLIWLFVIINLKKIKQKEYENAVFTTKMVALFLISYNISANSLPIFYRIAVYFSLFIPLLTSYLKDIINPSIAKFIVYISYSILFIAGVLMNEDLLPNQIMPLNAIYDTTFNMIYKIKP